MHILTKTARREATEIKAYDKFSDKSIRELYPSFEMPAFSDWREDWELSAVLDDEFKAFAEEYTSKKRRLGKCDSKEFVVFKEKEEK